MSACCANSCTGGDQYAGGEVVGVTSANNILINPGSSTAIIPPPNMTSDGNVRITCGVVCGSECYCPPSCLPNSYANGAGGGKALVVRMCSPAYHVCMPGGWLKSNITNGRVATSCSADPCCGPCP